MSVYNGMPHVRAAVESIEAQSFQDFEFIIINDASTDGSSDYVREAAQGDHRIRVITQENSGLTLALIRGVAESKTPLIARMDADDFPMPDRLSRQVALLDADSDLEPVTCGVDYVSEDLRVISSERGRSERDSCADADRILELLRRSWPNDV